MEPHFAGPAMARAQLEGDGVVDGALTSIKSHQLRGLLRHAKTWDTASQTWECLTEAGINQLHQTMHLLPDREGTNCDAEQARSA